MTTKENISSTSNQSDAWFGEMIFSLKTDKLMYDTDTMHPAKKDIFTSMMENNFLPLAKETRKTTSQYFISKMLFTYMSTLKENIENVLNIGFELCDTKIMVWAEIKEDDEATEDALLIAEAKVNAEYNSDGFRLLSTIVEDCDNLQVPENFISLEKSDA
jgi:hypothetical protein